METFEPAKDTFEKQYPKMQKKYRMIIMILSAIIAILVGIIIVLLTGKAGRPNSGTLPAGTAQFDGKYAIDSYTEYEFDGAGKGALCLGNTTRYIFDYSVHGDKVTFDYEDVKIPDMVYTYRFKGDDIIITLGDTDIEYTLAKENG